jgi:hypothetical protein
VVHRPTRSQGEAGSSSQTSDPTANPTSSQTADPTANPTSSQTAHPTATTLDSSTASSPDLPGRVLDPTSCLPLSVADRYVVEGWVRDRFRSHRYNVLYFLIHSSFLPLSLNCTIQCRSEICQKHYDAYETDEERLAHPPQNWPEDMWRWVVHYWGTEEFKVIIVGINLLFQHVTCNNSLICIEQKKRAVGKANKAKLTLKHTAGSENYKNKRYKIEVT